MMVSGRPPSLTPRPTPQTTAEDAAIYDGTVVPKYSQHFGRMIVREVLPGTRARILDVGCGTGHPSFDVLKRLDDGGRIVAIDRDPAHVDLARTRALGEAGRRLFFKVESVEDLSFGDEVFELVLGNLVLGGLDRVGEALSEMRRVLTPGGRLLLTRALSGTFEEILDMFREIALRRDMPSVAQRTEVVAARYPSASSLVAQVRTAGFEEVRVESETFKLPFRNAREIFEDAMIRFVALPEWRWVAGFDMGSDRILEDVEKTLDTYFGGGPISLTVHAGIVKARRPD
jgi:ubiquinone/menaquinone biosynthesis C-methylase UbiE